MRLHQWVKNVFVFLPVFFSGNLFNINHTVQALLGFFIFSFVASSVYIINDYVDIESDRNHPEKKNRPLASGSVRKSGAIFLLIFLLALTLLLTYFFGNLEVAVIVSAYFFMNIAYSFGLKHVAIIDVTIIAIGFLLRVLVGGFITDIPISDWTVLLTFTLALILALGKRRGEIINAQLTGKTRKALDGYSLDFLNIALAVSSTVTVICYVMYVLSPETRSEMHDSVFYTFVFVFVGVLRYLQQTFVFEKTESPTKMIYKDVFLQITIILWGISFILLIYLK